MSYRGERIGREIRQIADEIEKLDPSMAPVFTGFEHAGCPGDPIRGHFQAGIVLGYEASLEHAKRLLSETKQRLGDTS